MVKKLFSFQVLLLLFVSGCNFGAANNNEYKVLYTNEPSQQDDEKQQPSDYTVAIIPKVINIPYFNAVEEGAMEAGKDLGVKVIYKGPTIADSEHQIKIIDELIQNEEVDVIAVSANDPEKLVPVLKKAQNHQIKVITWDADTMPEARDFFINMVNPETLGRHLMDTLAWNVDEQGEFAIMTGANSASNLNEWLKWIKQHQKEYYPNMKLVEIAATDDDPNKAYLIAKQLIKDYPNLKGIIGNSSVGPPAAAQAVKETGKAGSIAVVGLSPPNPMNEYLKDGSAQIITLWSPKKLGYLTVALSKNIVTGSYPYDNQEIPGVGKIRRIDDVVIMGEPIDFTKENVDQYDF
ncbi:autoinducer 2 ABC transporter substrate-binding protein [Metabacillus litoralis]|uniref:autoinducer 2 ABC transporter substrate-binding protein n=1 Tax=Metabacillus TaxID=2675233 RepID=UPI001BA434C3|nr:autoinducer 2 ABC transporter substrate-binding protein [Metabacillus litoralis]MCM3408396.1 autoinducer 2 ABC transporter substrate-binding protein [Metabacillus litoralis]UHA59930.1 autoinducer 2 ABC transporter substrate-binding protein [Metabacillus litoralis]